MATRLTFLLDGRDGLSRVLDRIGDNATRLGRRMLIASINGDMAMRRLGDSTVQRMASMQRETNLGEQAVKGLRGALISLAPAAIPMVASLAPIAPALGAATAASAAYAVALGPQVMAMSEASEAEKKYDDAVRKSGRTSQAAITAQVEYAQAVADLPPETRRAAAGLSVMKDEYKAWSDELSGDTMGPVTKSLATFTALLPKTTGLARSMGTQLDRTITILAGGMESPGLDRTAAKFERFADTTLRKVNDGLLTLMRTDAGGRVGGNAREFMDYARAQGPAVAETVGNIARALMNVLQAGSEVGVGMLDVVNVLTGIVSAVPPEALATMLQLAIAIKAVRLAAVGMGAARTAMAAFGTQLLAMQGAAAAAPGRLSAVTAAIGALSRGAKLALAGTGIGLFLIAITELSQRGKTAPPDVDRLTTSLGKLGDTGKVTGEAAKAFGSDLDGLADSLQVLARPSTTQSIEKAFSDFFGYGEGGPDARAAKEDIEAVDKALSNLVSGGKADLAAAALSHLTKGMEPDKVKELKAGLDDYQAALANQAFEAKLAAQSMGVFGAQAQQVQQKLDAQKQSADGLAQAVNALSNQYLQARGGIRGMEAAIDAATESLKKNGATLDEGTEKGRANNQALDDVATATIKAAESARENGASWAEVNKIYDQGRAALLSSADAMGKNRSQAKALADQILRTPNKTALLKGDLQDLQAKLADAKARLAKAPASKTTKLRGEISDLQNKVARAQAALANLRDKSVTLTTRYVVVGDGSGARKAGSHGTQLRAEGGLIHGPGTGTSDDVPVWASNGEFMIRAKAVAKYGVSFLKAVNEGRLSMGAATAGGGAAMAAGASSAAGGLAGAGADAGRGLAVGLRNAAAGVDSAARVMAAAVTSGVRAELEIASPSKKMKALMADVGKGIVAGLTGTRAQIAATAKDLAKDIWAAWKGTNSKKDSHLVAMVTRDTKKLQKLAAERDRIAGQIAAAKQYRADLTSTAKQQTGLSSLGLADEEVSASSIKAGLQQKLARIQQFTRYVASLAKKGLNKSLLRQVLDMGPEQGYAYASALAGMDRYTLHSVNVTQAAIDKAATNLGGVGADVMYDAGKNASKGYLKGLDSQQAAIEKQMVKIAKAMDKAIRKALGIKSPSTVAAESGGFFTKGLGVGAIKQIPFLDRAMGKVTDRMSSVRPVIGRPAVVGAGAGGAVYNITVTVEQAMDPVAVGRELERVMTRFKRGQGR